LLLDTAVTYEGVISGTIEFLVNCYSFLLLLLSKHLKAPPWSGPIVQSTMCTFKRTQDQAAQHNNTTSPFIENWYFAFL